MAAGATTHYNSHDGAASTYRELGMIAEEQREFEMAREWYLKSLAIEEKQGNLHGAALDYAQLGNLAGTQGGMESCGRWLTRAIRAFRQAADKREAERSARNFFIAYGQASHDDKQKLAAIWKEADLGPFPTEPNS